MGRKVSGGRDNVDVTVPSGIEDSTYTTTSDPGIESGTMNIELTDILNKYMQMYVYTHIHHLLEIPKGGRADET